jgi:hypothetical protein
MRKLSVRGPLDKGVVRRLLRRSHARLRYCYEKQLLVDGGLSGELEATFQITAEGAVAKVGVTMSHANGEPVSRCVAETLRSLRSPKPRDASTVDVRVRIRLTPDNAVLWAKVRALLAAGDPGYLSAIGAIFGSDAPEEAAALAWWLVETQLRKVDTPPSGYALIAELLRVPKAGGPADIDAARRIVSEVVPRAPHAAAEIFESWGLADDAKRARKQWPSRFPTLGIGGLGGIRGTSSR